MADEDEEAPGLNHLPRELLFDIFSRCPPKSLYRLRCVCSKWLSLLTTDPDFISLYHRHHRLSPLVLFSRRAASTATGADGELVSSCLRIDNGLLRFKFAIGFAGELKSFTCSAALGYSAIKAEFKLIHLYTFEKFDNRHYSKVKELVCEVLTVPSRAIGFDSSSNSTESWRFLGKCPVNVLGRKSYVCVDGKIYWLASEKNYNPDCVRILSFDLVNEDFGFVCFPRNYSNRSAECLGLLEVGEKLCLTDRLPFETTMAVWELEDGQNNVWVKKYQIDLSRFDRHDMKFLGHVPSIGDGVGEVVIKLGIQDAVVYDLDKGTFREIHSEVDDEEEGVLHELELLLNRKHLL
ncbi:hypothetical protein V2J09_022674 [Rumex salicifolius]